MDKFEVNVKHTVKTVEIDCDYFTPHEDMVNFHMVIGDSHKLVASFPKSTINSVIKK